MSLAAGLSFSEPNFFTFAAAKQELPQAPADGDAEEGKLIISDTGEFCRSLQLDEGESGCTLISISMRFTSLSVYLHDGLTELKI